MTFNDVPPLYNYSSKSQIEVHKEDRQFVSLTQSNQLAEKPQTSNMIEGTGAIKSMELKGQWHDATPHREWQESPRTERIFHPSVTTDVDLVFYYRGRPTPPEEGKAFKELLKKHNYQLQPQDIEQLERTLGDFVDQESSNVTHIVTRELNGRQVVAIDGQWKSNNHQFRAIVMDGDGTGSQPHQVYLMAPNSMFDRYLAQFEESLKTIAWK